MGDNNVKHAHVNNKFGKQLFVFAMVFVLFFFIYVTFIHPHSSPDHVKVVRELAIQDAQAAKPAPAPAADPKTETAAAVASEPWTSTPEKLAKGAELFKVNCALCHGEKGLGNGPAGMALKPPPRNFAEGKWKQGNSTIALFNTISKGIPGSSMAAYESIIQENDRWALALHVKSISKNIVEPSAAEIKAFKEKKK